MSALEHVRFRKVLRYSLFLVAAFDIKDNRHDANLAINEHEIVRTNKITLFQVVSESQAVTTPLLNHTSGLMVHYSEGKIGLRLHWLNVMDSTPNSNLIQTGFREVKYSTKTTCTPVNFTKVKYELQDRYMNWIRLYAKGSK